jgi:hypothetical protein
MQLNWRQMACCEPDWYRAEHPAGAFELHMTWDEDEWVLTDGVDVLLHTGTTDTIEAQHLSENWRVNTTVNAQPQLI